MPMKCLQWPEAIALRLLPCLLLLALCIAGGWGMSDQEAQDLRFILPLSKSPVAETEQFQ